MAKHMEEKVKVVEKPEDAEDIKSSRRSSEAIKKNSLVSVLSRYNISHFEEADENNSRNLQTKLL